MRNHFTGQRIHFYLIKYKTKLQMNLHRILFLVTLEQNLLKSVSFIFFFNGKEFYKGSNGFVIKSTKGKNFGGHRLHLVYH